MVDTNKSSPRSENEELASKTVRKKKKRCYIKRIKKKSEFYNKNPDGMVVITTGKH